ncbi:MULTISPECIES: hypothetical protein [Xanthomonas]|uniref:hypothetical protein n=1 Tax=Xanthomonas TaxID=338 RepID=UPI000D68ABE7|nr:MULTISPECIES: hypothetical protein [Xanthomonas]PWH21628.1 hypothetical protein CDO09_19925 [Xanthomonas perforans]QXF03609.1 hypothetical protein KJA71_09220 [Xanthomonas citri pv. citri]QXO96868.1 hypothetical protein IG630_24270 [Xanthomonas sp. WG16]
MSIKRGQAPKKIAAPLKFAGVAEKFQLDVVFINRKPSEVDALIAEGKSVSEVILFLLDSWDTDYPLSVEGINELEDDHMGVCQGIIQGYYRARRVDLEKN